MEAPVCLCQLAVAALQISTELRKSSKPMSAVPRDSSGDFQSQLTHSPT